MSSLPLLLEQLASAQRAVVEALSSEYFCEDLEPPSCAFGWGEEALRDYFETGGESAPPKAAPAAPAADARPVIVCLGDSLTEFGSHVVGPKFADATLKNTPLASEVLRATDGNEEHGPGWVALLARDYQWRTTADVLNRGFSGMTSRLLRADLASIVASLPAAPVAAVVVTLGANDAAEGGVPRDEFRQNLDAICGALKELLPSAAVLLATPPPINHQVWPATTGGKGFGGGRSLERLKPYAEAVRQAAAGAGVRCVDLQADFTTRLMHWADTTHDGFHLATKGNVFVYRQVGEALRSAGLNPSSMPTHRPPALAAAVELLDDRDGRYARCRKR
mmetsp:Transcript_40263/g.117941  ORF Transcript_40263/g.117941 Transcript_40263/m.117941 type:complete len:335 (-) Transcript_40263:138-1142(-)